MRHAATWLLVAAVGGLAAAAGVDALRGGGEAEADAQRAAHAESARVRFADVAGRLRAAGIRGVLTYADEDCGLRALTLPDLEPHAAPQGKSCRFAVSPGGTLRFGREVGDPQRYLTARCVEGEVEVAVVSGRVLDRVPGCAPAWRPDGTLTVVRRGELVWLSRDVRHQRLLLSRRNLLRDLRSGIWEPARVSIKEVLWLSDTRLAAILRLSPGGELLAVVDRGRLLSPSISQYAELAGLRSSPSGRLVTARIAGRGGVAIVDRNGRPAQLALRSGTAVAWSPDERWAAEATADGIYFFRADERNPRFIHLPIVARDLVWR